MPMRMPLPQGKEAIPHAAQCVSNLSVSASELTLRIRSAPQDDVTIAQFFVRMWLDMGVPRSDLVNDTITPTINFLNNGRVQASLGAFILEWEGGPFGCAVYQLHQGLYPHVIREDVRHYGYIWVFMECFQMVIWSCVTVGALVPSQNMRITQRSGRPIRRSDRYWDIRLTNKNKPGTYTTDGALAFTQSLCEGN